MEKEKENLPEIKNKKLRPAYFLCSLEPLSPGARDLSDLVLACGANGAGLSSSSWFMFRTRCLVVNKHIVKRKKRKRKIPLASTPSTVLSTPCPC